MFAATKNDTYLSAAELSAQFVQAQLFNGTVIVDRIDVASCGRVNLEAATYTTGLAIEGLSAYINIAHSTIWSQ